MQDATAVKKSGRNRLTNRRHMAHRWCNKDQRESFGDMGLLMGMGLILVYLVMVAQFESWTDPFVIMFSVPFAATGNLALVSTNFCIFLGSSS